MDNSARSAGAVEPVRVSPSALDVLMPMHAIVDPVGVITHAGPVLMKIHPDQRVVGRRFFDLFQLRRPGLPTNLGELTARHGRKFHLRMRDADQTPLTAASACLGGGTGVLVNLSFGIAVIDAVARFDLAGSDFAATDLTLEMLYLVEAKSAAMAESRKLNDRLHGAKTQAEAQAQSDTLTGLDNRRALDLKLGQLLARSRPFTLMHLDLDFFKRVNDTLGHAAGDHVLTEVARILRAQTRQEDVVARVGGDEFVLLFPGITDRTLMARLAGRLIEQLEAPIAIGDHTARISASIGMVATTDYACATADGMMHDADVALYSSKEKGRGRYSFFDPEGSPA